MIIIPLQDRLMSKVQKTDTCWLFTGTKNSFGYGSIGTGGRKGKNIGTHRASWIIHNGEIPDGLFVLHKCDNPPCVNPEHLFLGTPKDNVRDMCSKGRNSGGTHEGLKGEKSPHAKLKETQVKEIRFRYKQEKITTRKLALEYDISCANVSFIINRKVWASV